MICQLDPPLPVYCPGKKQPGLAHLVIDYGPEHHLHWVVALENSEIWTLSNPDVRVQFNPTLHRNPLGDK